MDVKGERLGRGDDGVRPVREALDARPLVDTRTAAILMAQDESERAQEVIAAATANEDERSVLAGAAQQAAGPIRQLIAARQAAATSLAGRPFDLSSPTTAVPGTEPSLQMPSLGGRRPGLPAGHPVIVRAAVSLYYAVRKRPIFNKLQHARNDPIP